MDQKERRKLLSFLLINSGEFYIQRIKIRKKRRTRISCWMREWLIKRDSLSAYKTIFKELHISATENINNFASSRMLSSIHVNKF